MAFTPGELEMIESTVGELCRQSSPAHLADQLHVNYDTDQHAVTIYEERAPWDGEGEWTRQRVARFRFFRSRGEWFLYWMRANGSWDYYEGPRKRLSSLVVIVGKDTDGCFFG